MLDRARPESQELLGAAVLGDGVAILRVERLVKLDNRSRGRPEEWRDELAEGLRVMPSKRTSRPRWLEKAAARSGPVSPGR